MNIYTIIVTYNAKNWIRKCLQSVVASKLSSNIIVVDNNSSDKTKTRINDNYKSVDLIENDDNLGFGRANNIGIKKALSQKADFILLLNQDAWIETDCLNNLVAIFKENPKLGILSPMQFYKEGVLDNKFSTYCKRNAPDILRFNEKKQDLKDVYEVNFVNAAIWLISKECLYKSGIFNPIHSHYGEDRDLTNRVRYHGYKIGIATNAIAYHERNQSFPENKSISVKNETAKLLSIAIAFASDINKKFLSQIILAKLFLLKNILRGILLLKWKFVLSAIIALLKYAFKLYKVYENRLRIKAEGAFLSF